MLEHRAPKLLFQSFTVEAQRVGRARSPLRAGVGCADPASRAGILPSAPLRARLRLPAETLRRRVKVGRVPHVRDAPQSIQPKTFGGQRTARPHTRSGFGEAKPVNYIYYTVFGAQTSDSAAAWLESCGVGSRYSKFIVQWRDGPQWFGRHGIVRV